MEAATRAKGVMRIINLLRKPGEIRSVRLGPKSVIIRTVDDEVMVYRRVSDEDVSVQDVRVRRGSLSSSL